MFAVYFHPHTATRLRASPDVNWLTTFLEVLHGHGYARLTIQSYLHHAELFGSWLRTQHRALQSIRNADVQAFASSPSGHAVNINAQAAAYHLLEHLRKRGLVPPELPVASRAIMQEIMSYDAHLRDVVGLALATRQYRQRYAREFLESVFGNRAIRWNQIRVEQVRAFLVVYGQTGRIATPPVAASALRSYLKWLEFQGRIPHHVAASVPAIRRWRATSVPPILTDDQLIALLASFDQTTPVGRRDYAMTLCLTDLGLRVSEIETVRVGDLDVSNHTLRLAFGKPRRERILPLTTRVEQAILDYLQRGRPTTIDSHLFVRHRLPVGLGVSRELIRGIVRRAFAQVPGCESYTGTHILRHTTASRLLRAGADLKRIADILGHRSIDTTATYTRIDFASLVKVAQPWPIEEVLS